MLMLCRDDPAQTELVSNVIARAPKADVLQVKPCGKESEKNEDDFVEGALDWKEKQGEDDDMTLIIKALKEKRTKPEWTDIAPCGDEIKTLWAQWDSFRFIDGILYRVLEDSSGKREVLQVVVPTVLRKQVFGFLHDSKTVGHFGVNKTIGKIRMKFYWPKLQDDVKVWCAQCEGSSRKIKAPLATYVFGTSGYRCPRTVARFRERKSIYFNRNGLFYKMAGSLRTSEPGSRNRGKSTRGSVRVSFWNSCTATF